MRETVFAFGLSALLASAPVGSGAAAHDYPTAEIADYVFACMASNGQAREVLEQCACSIDVIASIVPFEAYEQAATVLSLRQVRGGGEKMAVFRDTMWARDAVDTLRRAQVEAELRCFH